MSMTKQEAIENHRKLWNWLADTAEKENRVVTKNEYFESNKLEQILSYCYCCEYDIQRNISENGKDDYKSCCIHCPVKWEDESDTDNWCGNSEFGDWQVASTREDIPEFIRLARIIANLPEREDAE